MELREKAIGYAAGDTRLNGVLFYGAHDAQRPGVLVVHGGAGLDNHAKARARGLAEVGFLAFACDMYGEGVAGDRHRVMAQITVLRDDRVKLVQRARAGLEVLVSQPQMDGRIAAVGYCFGGLTVLELARTGTDIAGVISIHGSLTTSRPAGPGMVKSKILVCHGSLDPHVPMSDVNAWIEEMDRAGADYQFIIYGGAIHGFTHEGIAVIPGVAYHALADRRSANAMKSFLFELFGM